MGVTYQLLDKNKKILATRVKQPCFSEFTWFRQQKPFTFTDIAYINYQVKTHMSVEESIAYLNILKDIGFTLTQTPEEILEKGYLLCLEDFRKTKHIYAGEIGGHLTVVRYLEEFNRTIANTLNILDISPDLDKWWAFQIAHVCDAIGVHTYSPSHGWFGQGHCLFGGDWCVGNPGKEWKQVQKDIINSPIWGPCFSRWDINKTYGHPYSMGRSKPETLSTVISDVDSLHKATTCVKSLYAHKANT